MLDTTTKSFFSINWGTGIFIFMTFFISASLYQVYKASQLHIPLIKEDYYQDDIHLAALLNSKNRAVDAGYSHNVVGQKLYLTLSEVTAKCIGSIEILSPFDSKLDKKIPITSNDGKVIISLNDLKSGKWIAKTTYTIAGQLHYAEHPLIK